MFRILLFLLFFSLGLHGQNNTNLEAKVKIILSQINDGNISADHKFKLYTKLSQLYNYRDWEKTKYYNRLIFKEAKEIGDQNNEAGGMSRYSMRMTVEGKLDSAKYYLYKSYDLARVLSDTLLLAKVEHSFGWYYSYTGNYALAGEYYDQSLKHFKLAKDTFGINNTYVKIGLLYCHMKDYKKSVTIYENLLNQDPENNLYMGNLASLYDDMKDTTNAIKYYKKSINSQEDKVVSYRDAGKLAAIYKLQNQVQREEKMRLIALEDAKRIGRPLIYYTYSYNYAEYLIRHTRFKEAVEILNNNSVDLSFKMKPAIEVQRLEILKDAYEGLGEYKIALNYSNKYIKRKAELLAINNLDRVIDRENKLKFEAKDEKIKELQHTQQESKSMINMLTASIIAALLLLFLSTILFIKNRRVNNILKTQNEKLDNSLSEKQTLLQETHHRVKNNLQIISSLLNIQRKYISDEKMNAILNNSKNRVKSMALVHQMLYQGKITNGINIKEYVDSLTSSLLSSLKADDERIKVIKDIDLLFLHEDSTNPIGLIINELFTNSIKYAFPNDRSGTIRISLHEVDKKLQLSVCDDGVGLPSSIDMSSETFGFSLVKSLSKKLKADIEISSKNGTCIELTIHNYTIVR